MKHVRSCEQGKEIPGVWGHVDRGILSESGDLIRAFQAIITWFCDVVL